MKIQKFWRVRRNKAGGIQNKLFSSFMRRHLENGTRYDQRYY